MMNTNEFWWWLAQHLALLTVLALGVWSLCRSAKIAPRIKHLLWLVVLVRLFVPPIASWPWAIELPASGDGQLANPSLSGVARSESSMPTIRLPKTRPSSQPSHDIVVVGVKASAPGGTAIKPPGSEKTTSPMAADSEFQVLPFPKLERRLPNHVRQTEVDWAFWSVAALGGFWLSGSIIVLVRMIRRIRVTKSIIDVGSSAPTWLLEDVARWSKQLGVRVPTCRLSEESPSPFIWQTTKLRLIWPASMQDEQHREAAQAILIHELAHLKRRDHWWVWLEIAVAVVWWWFPVALMARRQFRAVSEEACDEWVLRLVPSQRRDYAESLVRFAGGTASPQFAIGITGSTKNSRRQFEKRLRLIMTGTSSSRLSRWVLAGGILLAGLSVPVVGFEQARTAQPQQEKTTQQEKTESKTTASTKPAAETKHRTQDSKTKTTSKSAKTETTHTVKEIHVKTRASLSEVLERIESSYYGKIDRKELEAAAIEAILKKLDSQSQLLSKDEFLEVKHAVEGNLAGVGVIIHVDEDSNQATIRRVIVRSPAMKAGVKPGDLIRSVDGKTAKDMKIGELVAKLRGPRGSKTIVKVERQVDGQPKLLDIEIERDNFMVYQIGPWSISADGSEDFWLSREHKIGYVHVPSFNRNTKKQIEDVLRREKKHGLKSLILDLRFCYGGWLNAATDVADLFVDEGIIVSSKGRKSDERTVRATVEGTIKDVNLVVLVNRNTASAAEIVAACLQDHGRASVVGERTFGKGTVQALFSLSDGSALKLTTATWIRPNGKSLNREAGSASWGVEPNEGLKVKLDEAQTKQVAAQQQARLLGEATKIDDDPPLKKAVSFLIQDL